MRKCFINPTVLPNRLPMPQAHKVIFLKSYSHANSWDRDIYNCSFKIYPYNVFYKDWYISILDFILNFII